ncbi:hypothetical protein [Bdellovibrio svalbardensis]|uniref:Lipoprotein n=1 Tax=Bdellovibrio svalbardensis TaxID=2972972 RepID=A0ABT6DIB1_9BACT|nr:hypothetical protein [Bdellovibrio svalbardensis]MDG0816580.1 hypothetical protein [Bdellovibrio svalbardensis]
MKFVLLMLSMGFVLGACSHANCGAQKPENKAAAGGVMVEKSSSTDKVKVYKADGSLQCGQGKKIDLAEMQKGLKSIKVYSSENKNDGMMRIQLCGTPTGNSNVYEIDRKDLEAALKLGFKEWTAE